MGKLNKVVSDAKAIVKFLIQKSKKRKGPIRVGFMCQYIPSWNNVKGIYFAMLKDERFEPFIICVPSGISNFELNDPDSTENDTYDYYVSNGYDAINALVGKNEWLDLSSMALDYVFFIRPYEFYMPHQYAPGVLCKTSKVCLVLYGLCMSYEFMTDLLLENFMRFTYCFFAESEDVKKFNQGTFPLAHFLRLQKTVVAGIPSVSAIMEKRGEKAEIYDFAGNRFKIMWTPRWTTQKRLGGSNFFVYKDWILDYAEKNPDVACLLRPHPLAFDNFIKTGEMTKQEVEQYKNRIENLDNVRLDTSKEYISTLWNTDVLISDISGIMPDYFATGNPMIFCTQNMHHHLNDLTNRMLEGCYKAETVEDVEKYLSMLKAGDDPLKEKRDLIIEEIFGESCRSAIPNILNELSER